MARLFRALALTLCLAVVPGDAGAQTPQIREGFWFNIGLGAGSLGCSECDERVMGLSGGLALGGAANEQWLVGVFSNGWAKAEDGVTVTAGSLVFGARFYPSLEVGFFLVGGLGVGIVSAQVPEFGSISETGSGVLLGLGWDIGIASDVSLTPFWNGVVVAIDGGNVNFGQLGLGLTIH